MKWIADPQVSPDGTRVAFTMVAVDEPEDTYKTAVWIFPLGGGPPRALTFGPQDSQPRWSPDGTRLAFVRAGVGVAPQLFVLPMRGGEAVKITDLPKGASGPAWSPDGRTIAFSSSTNVALDGTTTAEFAAKEKDKPKKEPARIVTRPFFRLDNEGFFDFEHPSHVWTVPADGSETPRQRTIGAYAENSPTWTRDGRRIVFLSDRRPEPWHDNEDSRLYAIEASRPTPATDGDGIVQVAAAPGPMWAFAEGPNGEWLAAGTRIADPPRSYDQGELFLYERGATTPRIVSQTYDFEIGGSTIGADQHPPRGGGAQPLAFLPDGKHAWTTVGRHGAQILARIRLADGAIEEKTGVDLEVQAGTVSADGTKVALTVGSVKDPCVLGVYDAKGDKFTTHVFPNAAVLESSKLGDIESFWVDSFDGTKVQAWLVKPPGFDPSKKYPLILEIHGGPHTAYGAGFYHEFHVLAEAGYLVLYTNPRGSTTYGQAFGNVIQFEYPGDDYKDLIACLDAVVARGFVDESKLGVTGGSGGGLLTNWTIVQTNRFKAAVTQRCVSDWQSFWYSCDFTQFTHPWFRRAPDDEGESADYRRRSPVTFAAKIETPLLVLHSEEDWRTPIGQGESMFRALIHHRKPTVMARFPGEGHELSRSGAPSRRVQNQKLIRRWFDKWLLGVAAPEFDDAATRLTASSPGASETGAPGTSPSESAEPAVARVTNQGG